MHDGTSKTQVTGSISSTSIGSKVVSSIMMEIKLRGWRIKIQNTKDYGLSGKVDYMSNKFFMYLAILFHSTNKHKQGSTYVYVTIYNWKTEINLGYLWEYFWSVFSYSPTTICRNRKCFRCMGCTIAFWRDIFKSFMISF